MHKNYRPLTTINHLFRTGLLGLGIACVAAVPLVPASADTAPPAGTPATVSLDPLPTVQITGIVWAQVTVGNTVYATGRFTKARPAGSAAGTNESTRSNLLAYDIRTGLLKTDFVHSLTGSGTVEGRSIAASPDGTRLYVGGKFSAADSQARSNFAAFDLTTNTLLNYASGPNNTVRAIAATNSRVFLGGSFTSAGGQTRNRLAAYDNNGTLVSGWNPSITVTSGPVSPVVTALTVAPSPGNLLVGGYFNRINSSAYYSSGAVNVTTGQPVAWASQSSSYPIRDQLKSTATTSDSTQISSLSIDPSGAQAYLTSYGFVSTHGDGVFEGRAAINPTNGNIIWINDCHGDSYGAFPIGGVLYSVTHAHDCAMIGSYPETNPRTENRSLAESTAANPACTNKHTDSPSFYTDYFGWRCSAQLDWYPLLNTGTYSGSGQAAWSVTGNSSYVSLGGEFTKAENISQQGLVRYAIASLAPNKYGPIAYATGSVSATTPNSSGQSTITMKTTADRDNALLTYKLFRNGGSTAIYTTIRDTRYWNKPSFTFTDTGLTPGSTNSYKLTATDPFGNSVTTNS